MVFAIMPTLTSTMGANISCGARLSWLGTAIVAALGVALQKARDTCTVLGVVALHDRGVGRDGSRDGGEAMAIARSATRRRAHCVAPGSDRQEARAD